MRALLVLVATSAAADELPTIETELPAAVRVTSVPYGTRIERAALAVHSAPEASWLTLTIAGRNDVVHIGLDVPAGTRVFGLGVTSEAANVWGRPEPARGAHPGSGAAVTWQSRSADQDHLVLAVFAPATVELALHLPPLPLLAVDAGAGTTSIRIDGTAVPARRTTIVELHDVAGSTSSPQVAASEHVAIVASPTPASAFFEHPATFGIRVMRDIDKTIIRRYVKRHYPQLRRCYMAVAQWNPRIRGGAILSFWVAPSGTIEWAGVSETELPRSVTDCLVAEVKRWEFPEADGHVRVNYPLEFRLADQNITPTERSTTPVASPAATTARGDGGGASAVGW